MIGPTPLLSLPFSDMNVFQVFSVVTNTSVSMDTASIKLLRPVCWHYPFLCWKGFLFRFCYSFSSSSHHLPTIAYDAHKTTLPNPPPFLHHRYRSTFTILVRHAFQSKIIRLFVIYVKSTLRTIRKAHGCLQSH